ncbi:CHAD domain-containing protein [Ancylobacter sonchi]|uniref:CYTH and CHAD domain-containing protein n=1 Tax=Ancylobacter sonchi TaxID=1937790 RepID=UPI001BD25FAD|nr:CYTH and CHAD domain-containing protein [Ancylobacter sonchi]MBS7534570.1 CHAD domain-containing protein [Ancylobacter sonchi]
MPDTGTTMQQNEDGKASAPENREVELKLLTDPATLARLVEAPVILRHATSKGIVRRLEATYYDTADAAIAAGGGSFRVRRSGKQHVQTLKLASQANPLQRPELEATVPDMAPQLDALPLIDLGAPFETLQAADLVSVFTTRIRRHTKTVPFGGAVIEIAFDEGELIAGERTEPVCEIELELKSGEAGALYELALSLLEHGTFRVGTQSKAERGYALAFGTRPRAAKAPASGVAPTDIADEVIAKTLMACQRHIIANLVAAELGQETEGVHQLRVALRRLRTAISVFGREIPASALQSLVVGARMLASALGPARNWDVFQISTIADIEGAALPGIDFADIRTATVPLREAGYATARAALLSPDCTHFLLSLGRVIERRSWRNDIGIDALAVLTQPAQHFAGRALGRLNRKATKQGQHLRRLEPEARHELRLTLKKLRYAAEFFLPLFDEDEIAQKYLKRMARLQDVLGIDNDVTTTQSLLREIEASTSSPQVHRAIGAVTGWQGRDRIEMTSVLRQTWQLFADARPFWS